MSVLLFGDLSPQPVRLRTDFPNIVVGALDVGGTWISGHRLRKTGLFCLFDKVGGTTKGKKNQILFQCASNIHCTSLLFYTEKIQTNLLNMLAQYCDIPRMCIQCEYVCMCLKRNFSGTRQDILVSHFYCLRSCVRF